MASTDVWFFSYANHQNKNIKYLECFNPFADSFAKKKRESDDKLFLASLYYASFDFCIHYDECQSVCTSC